MVSSVQHLQQSTVLALNGIRWCFSLILTQKLDVKWIAFSFANNKNLHFHHVPWETFFLKLVQVRLKIENQKTKETMFALLFLKHFPDMQWNPTHCAFNVSLNKKQEKKTV